MRRQVFSLLFSWRGGNRWGREWGGAWCLGCLLSNQVRNLPRFLRVNHLQTRPMYFLQRFSGLGGFQKTRVRDCRNSRTWPLMVVTRPLPHRTGSDTTRVSHTHRRISGFGIVQGHRSGLSHCGMNDPPKLAFSDDGSMNLTYPSEIAPVALFGAFVVPTPCSTPGGGPKKADAPPCDESFYLFEQLEQAISRFHGTPNITLRALGAASKEVNQSIATGQYFRWHTPWPAYMSPFGIYVGLTILLSCYAGLKLARKTE